MSIVFRFFFSVWPPLFFTTGSEKTPTWIKVGTWICALSWSHFHIIPRLLGRVFFQLYHLENKHWYQQITMKIIATSSIYTFSIAMLLSPNGKKQRSKRIWSTVRLLLEGFMVAIPYGSHMQPLPGCDTLVVVMEPVNKCHSSPDLWFQNNSNVNRWFRLLVLKQV